jgi:hypothetical protein
VFVEVALEAVVNLFFQHSRAGVAEDTNGNLTIVLVRTLDIYEDFDVTRLSVARNNAGNLHIRRRFARGFSGDLRNRSNGKSVFNHDAILICDPAASDDVPRKNLRGRYIPALAVRYGDFC